MSGVFKVYPMWRTSSGKGLCISSPPRHKCGSLGQRAKVGVGEVWVPVRAALRSVKFVVYNQIEEIFRVKVDKMERDGEYREIFSFCRMTIMKQSPAIYSRVNLWFRRYDSAKAMIFGERCLSTD